jgi:hypothetical protein
VKEECVKQDFLRIEEVYEGGVCLDQDSVKKK